jgi:hypothetical protein
MINPVRGKNRLSIFAIRARHTHPSFGKRTFGALIKTVQFRAALIAGLLLLDVLVPKGPNVTMIAKRANVCPCVSRFDLIIRGNHHIPFHRDPAAATLARLPFCLVHWLAVTW